MRPTYDELLEIIEEQRKTIARLEKRVAELEERLNLNSQNSSKPPSSDQKKNKQKPKGGAVKGHQDHHRKPIAEIDKRIFSPIEQCEHCGSKDLKKKSPRIFQQIEIPEIKPLVTQIECEKPNAESAEEISLLCYPKSMTTAVLDPSSLA